MKFFLTSFLLLTCRICFGQNLVPNPSFEVLDTCPNGGGQIWHAIGWYNVENTPDFFNACLTGTLAGISVPNNSWGGQVASTGVSYCGICCYNSYATNWREKVGIQLLSPLSIGTKYFVSFMISNTKSTNPYFNGSSNKMGMLFSTTKYDLTNPAPTNNFCQVWSDSIYRDTTTWNAITGSFIADSTYSFITIGNFFDDSNTDTASFTGNDLLSFYFVDDVCVSTDSLACISTVGIHEPKQNIDLNISPNPFSNQITFSLSDNKQATLCIYDILSKKILQKTFTNATTINTEQFASGIYFYELNKDKTSIKKGKIIKQ